MIEISWITITSGNPTFISVFALRSITICYDIVTIRNGTQSKDTIKSWITARYSNPTYLNYIFIGKDE